MEREYVDRLYTINDWSLFPLFLGVFLIIAVITIIKFFQKEEKLGDQEEQQNIHAMSRPAATGLFLLVVALILGTLSYIHKEHSAEAREAFELQESLQYNIVQNYEVSSARVYLSTEDNAPENTAHIYEAEIVLQSPHDVVKATVYHETVKNLAFITPVRDDVEFNVRKDSRVEEYLEDRKE